MTSLPLTLYSQQLVNLLTGFEENSEPWKRCVNKTKSKLTQHRFTSTDEYQIDTRYRNLQEKFSIKDRERLGQLLEKYKSKLLEGSRPIGSRISNQRILKYDMLSLILACSPSLAYDYKEPSAAPQPENKELTWADIIAEEPLEGDHWVQNEDLSSDEFMEEFDSDDYSKEQKKASKKSKIKPKPIDPPVISAEEEDAYYASLIKVDNRADPDTLEDMESLQYWRDGYYSPMEISGVSTMQDPSQLSKSLSRHNYGEYSTQNLEYIDEANMVREVLFLLKGYSGVVFKEESQVENDQKFYVNTSYSVHHLSHRLLTTFLEEFCENGNLLADLRQRVYSILGAPSNVYGQTSQAFAAAVINGLNEFERTLSGLEAKCSYIAYEKDQSISLLQIKQRLHEPIQCFKIIHSILFNSLFKDPFPVPRELATYLIYTLYDISIHSQLAGQTHSFHTFLYLFRQTLKPYGQLMDDWIFYGTLRGDVAREFFVTRKMGVKETSLAFWSEGFRLHTIDQKNVSFPCPLFEESMLARVFFTGKAVCLISRLLSHNENCETQDHTFLETILDNVLPPKYGFFFTALDKMEKPQIHTSIDAFSKAVFPLAFDCSFGQSRVDNQTTLPDSPEEGGSLLDRDFIHCLETYIESSYEQSADRLNTLLHKNGKMDQHLRSIASIYLMLEDNMMDMFCETLFLQMDQKKAWHDKRTLNNIFAEAGNASGRQDTQSVGLYMKKPDREEESIQIDDQSYYLGHIVFNYTIPWPINNFIRQSSLVEYNKITALLLRIKRAKYILEQKTLQGRTKVEVHPSTMRFYALRMRMMWFVNVFWGYIMTTILHSETRKLQNNISQTTDADEITLLHDQYVGRIVDRCLLNDKSKPIKKAMVHILSLVERLFILFETYVKVPLEGQEQNQEASTKAFTNKITFVEKDFNRTNEFITTSLGILGKKGGLSGFVELAASLSLH
ncbi:Spc98 family-domain-containing protein [Phycomyces nitens]|nr:Spc98 family-domain-containing protein [Phycomyces nitens]